MVSSVLGPDDIPGFLTAAVAESSQLFGEESVILAVLQVNVALQIGSVMEMVKLIGSSSSDISENGAVVSSVQQGAAAVGSEWKSKWDAGLGMLEVVVGSAVEKGQYIRMLFHLQNPLVLVPGVVPVVRVKSRPGAHQRDLVPANGMSGTCLSSIVAGTVLSASLKEKSSVQGSENPISLDFSLDFNVGAGT